MYVAWSFGCSHVGVGYVFASYDGIVLFKYTYIIVFDLVRLVRMGGMCDFHFIFSLKSVFFSRFSRCIVCSSSPFSNAIHSFSFLYWKVHSVLWSLCLCYIYRLSFGIECELTYWIVCVLVFRWAVRFNFLLVSGEDAKMKWRNEMKSEKKI